MLFLMAMVVLNVPRFIRIYLFFIMQDNLPGNLPDTETRNSTLFWEELFSKGVSVCDQIVKGSSGKDLYESYDISI